MNLFLMVSEAEKRTLRSAFRSGLTYAVATSSTTPTLVKLLSVRDDETANQWLAAFANTKAFKAESETVWELIS